MFSFEEINAKNEGLRPPRSTFNIMPPQKLLHWDPDHVQRSKLSGTVATWWFAIREALSLTHPPAL